MSNTAAQQYLTQQIMTASPAMLVFMLYDKAINCLREAVRAIEANDVEARWRANVRAMEIISHLQSTLDMEKGGDVSKNLDQLYTYMMSRLPKIDMRNDPQPARDVIGLLEPLRNSWRELANQGDKPMREAARISAELAAAAPAVQTAPSPYAAAQRPVQAPSAPQGLKISA